MTTRWFVEVSPVDADTLKERYCVEALQWQQALQQEGIRCQVLGDYLDAGIGDIPGMTAEVWVETAGFVRAEAILRQNRDRSEEPAQPDENS